jgi:hypothetical protein
MAYRIAAGDANGVVAVSALQRKPKFGAKTWHTYMLEDYLSDDRAESLSGGVPKRAPDPRH